MTLALSKPKRKRIALPRGQPILFQSSLTRSKPPVLLPPAARQTPWVSKLCAPGSHQVYPDRSSHPRPGCPRRWDTADQYRPLLPILSSLNCGARLVFSDSSATALDCTKRRGGRSGSRFVPSPSGVKEASWVPSVMFYNDTLGKVPKNTTAVGSSFDDRSSPTIHMLPAQRRQGRPQLTRHTTPCRSLFVAARWDLMTSQQRHTGDCADWLLERLGRMTQSLVLRQHLFVVLPL
jgi:hypothetical protein